MFDSKKNTWTAKIRRTITAFLPVSADRNGNCIGCGNCCKLPVKCLFLREKKDGSGGTCWIYKFRPPTCRKYPRIQDEHITGEKCGYSFESK